MDNLTLYLAYLDEGLEDLKIPKKKWYDLLNMQRRKIYQQEILRQFKKLFIVKHPIINNKKTKISVSLPLVGYNYHVEIRLYDKRGKEIIDYEHEGNSWQEPLVVQLQLKGKKWTVYYHTLFIKDEHQGKKLGSVIVKTIDEVMRKLQQTKFAWYQASDIGKYAWSKIPGTKFRASSGLHSRGHVEKNYQRWCHEKRKKCKAGRKPSDYPKDFLLSNSAPEFIDYDVPIG